MAWMQEDHASTGSARLEGRTLRATWGLFGSVRTADEQRNERVARILPRSLRQESM